MSKRRSRRLQHTNHGQITIEQTDPDPHWYSSAVESASPPLSH